VSTERSSSTRCDNSRPLEREREFECALTLVAGSDEHELWLAPRRAFHVTEDRATLYRPRAHRRRLPAAVPGRPSWDVDDVSRSGIRADEWGDRVAHSKPRRRCGRTPPSASTHACNASASAVSRVLPECMSVGDVSGTDPTAPPRARRPPNGDLRRLVALVWRQVAEEPRRADGVGQLGLRERILRVLRNRAPEALDGLDEVCGFHRATAACGSLSRCCSFSTRLIQ
jgi:hypothetical protein